MYNENINMIKKTCIIEIFSYINDYISVFEKDELQLERFCTYFEESLFQEFIEVFNKKVYYFHSIGCCCHCLPT